MAKSDTFHLDVITPERAVLRAEATFVAVPAWDGEIGVLAHRAPLLARLGVGWLRADTTEGKKTFLIDGGFCQVVDNRVTVLTEHAQEPAEVKPGMAAKTQETAQAMRITDEASLEARSRMFDKARAQRKVGG